MVIIINIVSVINIVVITDNLAKHFCINRINKRRKISLPPVRKAVKQQM